MVDGRVVFENGRVTTVDEDALLAEAREHLRAPRSRRSERAGSARPSSQPAYRAMVRRGRPADVGMNRWVGVQ